MVDFRGVLEDRSVNAAVAWLATGALGLSTAVLLVADTWLWAAFALLVVGVASFPPVRTRDATATLPGELVALVALAVGVRATGLLLQITPFATMAGLALLVLLVLDGFTSLRMAPRFAVLFVVVTTMAFAGVWAIVEFGADAVLGTEYVVGKREQNLDLITATVVGLVAGVVFAGYFRETDGEAPLDRHSIPFPFVVASSRGPSTGTPTDEGQPADDTPMGDGTRTADDVPRTTEDDGPATDDAPDAGGASPGTTDSTLGSVFSSAGEPLPVTPWYRRAVRLLQLVIVVVCAYALATGQGTMFVNGVGSLAVTFLPTVVRWWYGYRMQAGLALLIALAATLHVIGILGPYATTDWYDTFTHALSSTLVAGVGYAIVRSIELDSDTVAFPARFRGLFVVLFVLAVGVLWEIAEFASGLTAGLFGRSVLTQYGVGDIITDLAFNVVGALVVALWGTPLFRRPARALRGSVGERLR